MEKAVYLQIPEVSTVVHQLKGIAWDQDKQLLDSLYYLETTKCPKTFSRRIIRYQSNKDIGTDAEKLSWWNMFQDKCGNYELFWASLNAVYHCCLLTHLDMEFQVNITLICGHLFSSELQAWYKSCYKV